MKQQPLSYDEARLQRIATMESIYERSRTAMDTLMAAAKQYLAVQQELKTLANYYASPQWLADFDADCAGKIPSDMKRGILAEDTIYDLLTDIPRLQQLLKKIRNVNKEFIAE